MESVKVIKDKSVAIVDCGASSTLTGSLINATDIEEKVTIIETADGEERMRSTCYAASDIRSSGEQSGRTTGRLGSTGLQSVPSEGRHSWHSGAHPPPPSSPGRVTLSEDYGPGVAAGGWTSPPPPPAIA